MWFEKLTGFEETSPRQVRTNLELEGDVITSRVNDRVMSCGHLDTPSLGELRAAMQEARTGGRAMACREVVADVKALHADPANAGALFQVASQFNLLEMASPDRTPEEGVGIYQFDPTQGPACAISAGGATIYRNYFVEVDGRIGQSTARQIDCLADLGHALGNADGSLWKNRNGYALLPPAALQIVRERLVTSNADERDALRKLLRIGVHRDVEVTLDGGGHRVTQAFCSALPVGYSDASQSLWQDFAILVLEAAYEATLCAAIQNMARTGSQKVYLTLLGGGAFGNTATWIISAMCRALLRYRRCPLDVAIVSYGQPDPRVAEVIAEMRDGLAGLP